MPSSQVFQGDEIPELGRDGSGELVSVKLPARGAPWRKEGVGGGSGGCQHTRPVGSFYAALPSCPPVRLSHAEGAKLTGIPG